MNPFTGCAALNSTPGRSIGRQAVINGIGYNYTIGTMQSGFPEGTSGTAVNGHEMSLVTVVRRIIIRIINA
jgi:hypothetical protein